MKRRSAMTPFLLMLAGALVRRGATGQCSAYRRLGINTASVRQVAGVPDGKGIRVERNIQIRRASGEVFAYWRHLENLPRFMSHVRSVKQLTNCFSHWEVEGPIGPLEWDAEIINEHPDELIAWQTLPGAEVQSAGTVRFNAIEEGKETEVSVLFQFHPPAGKLGGIVAGIFGESPDQQLEQDLVRLKQILETEISA